MGFKTVLAATLSVVATASSGLVEPLETFKDVVVGPPKALAVDVRVKSSRVPFAADLRPAQDDLMPARKFKDFYDVRTRSIGDAGAAAASGTIQFGMATVGWNNLEIETNVAYLDDSQAYAAGYVEGSLTQPLMLQNIVNEGANSTWDPALAEYLRENMAFMHQNIVASPVDMYWRQVWLTLLQLQGLYDGYIDSITDASQWVPIDALINIQIGGDMDDLATAIGLQRYGRPLPLPKLVHRAHHRRANGIESPENDRVSRETLVGDLPAPTTEGGGHCSAVCRLLPGNADIFISQISWSGLEDMNRIYKTYRLNYLNASLPGKVASFSSFPGSLFSGDDWYTLQPSNLVVLETTIGNSNATLYKLYVKPTTVLDWMRNIVANRLATSGETWAMVFSEHNSGTYNNEFFILDYKLFTPGMKRLAPGTFTVLDQAPGFISTTDRTADLETMGYFGSYNVASDVFIYNITGSAQLAQQLGPWFSWHDTARANIFRRDAPNVVDEDGFRRLVRSNNFQHDPLSTQSCTGSPPYSAENVIAARDDLNPKYWPIGSTTLANYTIGALGHRDHVAIDAKYTSYKLFFQNQPNPDTPRLAAAVSVVQAGPTYDQQPPFDWAQTSPDIAVIPHLGIPQGPWQMPWVSMSPAEVTLDDGETKVTVTSPVAV